MAIAMFYHLTRSSPEETMTTILPRALQAGWRVMLRGGDLAALQVLDAALWLGPEDGFLPHGLAGGPQDGDQPILLGTGAIGNAAQALMLIDGAECSIDETVGLERIWVIFDGGSDPAVKAARGLWTKLTGAGMAAQYWSEETGRWQKKTEKAARS